MAMRITNNMMIGNYIKDLTGNMGRMNKLQRQMATGKRIVRLSDDPVGIVKSLNARSRLSGIEQFRRNIDDARTWLTHSETTVSEVNEIIKRAKELATYMANGTHTDESRSAMASEVVQLRDQILTSCNARLGDNYVFGGYNVTVSPFEVDTDGNVFFNGVNLLTSTTETLESARLQEIEYNIGYTDRLEVSVSGMDVMGTGNNNLYKMLFDFANALNDPNSTEDDISAFIDRFGNCQTEVLAIATDIGGRINRLDIMEDRYSQDYINYTELKSKVEDIDQAETYMWFAMAEAVYKASMAIGSRVIQPSLMDFLR